MIFKFTITLLPTPWEGICFQTRCNGYVVIKKVTQLEIRGDDEGVGELLYLPPHPPPPILRQTYMVRYLMTTLAFIPLGSFPHCYLWQRRHNFRCFARLNNNLQWAEDFFPSRFEVLMFLFLIFFFSLFFRGNFREFDPEPDGPLQIRSRSAGPEGGYWRLFRLNK